VLCSALLFSSILDCLSVNRKKNGFSQNILSAVQAEYGSQGMTKDNFEQADLSAPAGP